VVSRASRSPHGSVGCHESKGSARQRIMSAVPCRRNWQMDPRQVPDICRMGGQSSSFDILAASSSSFEVISSSNPPPCEANRLSYAWRAILACLADLNLSVGNAGRSRSAPRRRRRRLQPAMHSELRAKPRGTLPVRFPYSFLASPDADADVWVFLDARFEVLGSPYSLLSVTLSASQKLYTRRGTLVAVAGNAENVCGSRHTPKALTD
jgi:hypothetical protein